MHAPNAALRSIAMTSQFDGASIDDGDRARRDSSTSPLSDAERIDVELARAQPRVEQRRLRDGVGADRECGRAAQPALHPELRLRVLDALYSNGDRAAATSRRQPN